MEWIARQARFAAEHIRGLFTALKDLDLDSDLDWDSDPHCGHSSDDTDLVKIVHLVEEAAFVVKRRRLLSDMLVAARSSGDTAVAARRASVRAAIAGLKEVSMERDGESCCAICLDQHGSAVSLPCSHVYHRDCLVAWLQIKTSCPLCEYDMMDMVASSED